MSHSYHKIWIHAVWATKERSHLIKPEIEKQIFSYISNQLREMGCPVRIVNGMEDHVHCLFLMNYQKSIAEIIKQIKGSSSHFINQQNLTKEKFSWQVGYASFSVSESGVDHVYNYIAKQKQHHLKRNFQQEYDAFIDLHHLNDHNNG